jgi:predicted DNA-binding transcriptional regulator AlpA
MPRARRLRPAPEGLDLVDAGEIARRLELRDRTVVLDWRLHRFHFPAPVMRGRTYLWKWSDVEAWSNEHAAEVVAHRVRH